MLFYQLTDTIELCEVFHTSLLVLRGRQLHV
jgi:hypothetical protein